MSLSKHPPSYPFIPCFLAVCAPPHHPPTRRAQTHLPQSPPFFCFSEGWRERGEGTGPIIHPLSESQGNWHLGPVCGFSSGVMIVGLLWRQTDDESSQSQPGRLHNQLLHVGLIGTDRDRVKCFSIYDESLNALYYFWPSYVCCHIYLRGTFIVTNTLK